MLRTHNNGELRLSDVGKVVQLCGWVSKVRNLGSLVFVDLRDHYGITQLNIDPELLNNLTLHNEDCIQIEGKVCERSSKNSKMDTGDIEISVSNIKVLSTSVTPPFNIENDVKASEETRLKYRYLDLRRPKLQNYLNVRHRILIEVRKYLESLQFNEIFTPTLVKSTPEGARDYLVPSRIYKGQFYALPQSPQIYKQILMISGFDKYYQIAVCYRDEDLRADRQPEFVQIDCEMSFVERQDVLNVIEGLLQSVFKNVSNIDIPPFQKMAYDTAINVYGSDKPDLRFDMPIIDVTDILSNAGFEAYNNKKVRCIVVNNIADSTSRSNMDKDNELVKENKLFGVSHMKFLNGKLSGGITNKFDENTINNLVKKLNLKENDLVIVGADANPVLLSSVLGLLRLRYGDKLGLRPKDKFAPLFIIDWPMFEAKEDGTYECLSNPFTRPTDETVHILFEDKSINPDFSKIFTYSYDTVINGVELSSGALRIYNQDVQNKVFESLGLTKEDIENKFGFFIDALKYGTPPMGGFGIGLERLCMVLAETDNIRDVVAFPKNLSAYCPMAQCPSKVETENVDILGLEVKKEFK